MPTFLRRLRARLKYGHHTADVAREIELHRILAEEQARGGGVSDADAKARAARQLGNITLAREAARSVWVSRWIDAARQDTRYAVRMLWRNPGFAATAIGALVLGVSLNLSLFTVFNTVAWQPWAVPFTDRVVLVQATRTDKSISGVSPVESRYLRDRAHSADVIAFSETRVQLGADPTAPTAPARLVSANYFPALKLALQHGAGFRPSDDEPATARAVAVIGARVWRTQFNADASVIGRDVLVNNVPFTIVGVAQEGARDSVLSPPPDVWIPVASRPLMEPNDEFSRKFPTEAGHCCVKLAARLRDGVDVEAAALELAALDIQYMADHTELRGTSSTGGGLRVTSTRMADQPQASRFVPAFLLMFAGTGLLLLLACANVGNLLLARAMARQREIGVRLALGAARGRVVRQLLTEGLVIAGIATLCALPIANILPSAIFGVIETSPEAAALVFAIDRSVLFFSIAVMAATSVLFSLAPALRGTRLAAASVRSGRGNASATGRVALRTALLAVQVAISAVLIISAGLLSRGIIRASAADLGFKADGVVAATISLPKNAYTPDAEAAMGAELERSLAAAAIGPVGATNVRPMSQSRMGARVPVADSVEPTRVELHEVSPGYFSLLGVRLTAGRVFQPNETHAIVVNRTLARLFGAGDRAIGRPLGPDNTSEIIVGIVDDAQLTGLGPVAPTFFRASPGFAPYILLRDTPRAAGTLRATLAGLDKRATLTIAPLSDGLREEMRTAGVGAGVATLLALSAILLASIGVFGVFSFMVTERQREIGVRLALGARAGDVIRTVLGGAAIAIGSGLAVGLALAFVAGSLLSNNLYGLSPRDPVSFGLAIAVLALAAVVSMAGPLRRALRVDPAVTLRQD